MTRDERQDAWASLRMIADAVGELFGPAASIESEDASLLRGPEYHHFAQGVVEALMRVRQSQIAENTRALQENTAAIDCLGTAVQNLQMEMRNR